MATLTDLEKKQIAQAEEIFFSGPQKEGFCKDLFFGRFRDQSIMPYPELPEASKKLGDEILARVTSYCENEIDPAQIDRDAEIPDRIVKGLGDIGVLGMTIETKYGGLGMCQQNFCRIMEVIGGHCGSTAVFVNAHHSIGLRALELFGTEEQKTRWMGPLARGEQTAAFALTEPEAGSDAGNVRTRAELASDGEGYVLNGEKRWITNGGIADVVTVMARTPDPADPDGKITAFPVPRESPGFEVIEKRMEKCGIRGTATGRLRFHNMYVPKSNILGPLGKGLRVALTVLDFGRTTFGASCTGAAKFCLRQMVQRANTRIQFGKTLGQFELVQKMIAQAAADTYAMESCTYQVASLIDSGAEDYMVETAMLKVWSSDQLWRIVNDCLQVWGGAGFFTDQPFERMMRDARLNLIGEGANDVLRCFIAAVGLRHLGKEMEAVLRRPWTALKLFRSEAKVLVKHEHLRYYARQLGKQIAKFAWACEIALVTNRESIINKQFIQARLGDIATELFVASCVYSRLSALLVNGTIDEPTKMREYRTGALYLRLARRRNRIRFDELNANFDQETVEVANDWLQRDLGQAGF
ncbi:MAG TPA: acyl-CoA dehydrogenase family protein [Pirellulaceae bacterium]|nr:acyl-CoA dehydrogenase family protein [Pirellulaceae bacterium]